jgi:CRP-like cAMP-binding protein
LLDNSLLLKVRRDQALYKQGDKAEERSYIVLVGRIALKGFTGPDGEKFETLGEVKAGDTFGEEGAYEIGTVYRKETTFAEEDTFVLEICK